MTLLLLSNGSTNSFGQFLLLTELKIGGPRRSNIIPEGKEIYDWRAFGLELRKMLNPSQYAVGGTSHPKFIPQVLRHNLEAQNSRTFAKAVQGFHGRVEDRKQLKQLGITIKGKLTQLGEEKMGVTPGKTDKVISRSSIELFLSDFFLNLSRARLVDLGVNDRDEGGWDNRASLKQGIDNNGFRLKTVLEHDQSNLAMIPMKAVCDVPGASVLVEEEMDISDMGLGGGDSLSIPLMTITPFGLALSVELTMCEYVGYL